MGVSTWRAKAGLWVCVQSRTYGTLGIGGDWREIDMCVGGESALRAACFLELDVLFARESDAPGLELGIAGLGLQ